MLSGNATWIQAVTISTSPYYIRENKLKTEDTYIFICLKTGIEKYY
jgi:hypothetical protein